jgi:hypothetical protein
MNTIFKHGIFAIMAIAMVCGLCSCNDNNSEQKATQTISSAYCYIIDKTTGKITHSDDLLYVMDFNYTKSTADITISNLTLPNGVSYGDFKVENVPLTYNNYWEICTTNTPSVSSASNRNPNISTFSLKLLDRTYSLTLESIPGFFVSFTVDNYTVQSSYAPFVLLGTTVSTPQGGDAYTTEETTYSVSLNHTAGTANIRINNARFHARMPEGLIMDFKDIPFNYMADGTISLSAEEVIPYIGNTPYNDQYPVSNLNALIDPTEGMDLQFTCTVFNTPFSVNAQVGY